MGETAFLKGHWLLLPPCRWRGAVFLTDARRVNLPAFLGTGIAVQGSLAFYTGTILDYWEQEDPGACAARQRMLPPWFVTAGGRYLCIDPCHSYRPKDRELVEE